MRVIYDTLDTLMHVMNVLLLLLVPLVVRIRVVSHYQARLGDHLLCNDEV